MEDRLHCLSQQKQQKQQEQQKLEGKEQWLQLQEQQLQEHLLVGTEHQLAAFRQPWQQQY